MTTPTVVLSSTGGWDFSWPAGTPPYQVWSDGVLLETTTEESYHCSLPGYEETPPDVEVVDSTEVAESSLYPPYLLLQWRGVQGAMGYSIQQYLDSEWADVGTLTESGRGYYSWSTPPQDDGDNLVYRVLAISLNGGLGVPIGFQVTMVRNPAHPAVTLEIESTGNLVVS